MLVSWKVIYVIVFIMDAVLFAVSLLLGEWRGALGYIVLGLIVGDGYVTFMDIDNSSSFIYRLFFKMGAMTAGFYIVSLFIAGFIVCAFLQLMSLILAGLAPLFH